MCVWARIHMIYIWTHILTRGRAERKGERAWGKMCKYKEQIEWKKRREGGGEGGWEKERWREGKIEEGGREEGEGGKEEERKGKERRREWRSKARKEWERKRQRSRDSETQEYWERKKKIQQGKREKEKEGESTNQPTTKNIHVYNKRLSFSTKLVRVQVTYQNSDTPQPRYYINYTACEEHTRKEEEEEDE